MFRQISLEEERIGKGIVNAAYVVHKELGPGLLEKVYEGCFCHVLTQNRFAIKRQLDIPIVFDGIIFEEGIRVNDLLVCELKVLENVNPL
jgi:GxxExxY protein